MRGLQSWLRFVRNTLGELARVAEGPTAPQRTQNLVWRSPNWISRDVLDEPLQSQNYSAH